jgi:hypothetical protein
MVDWSSPLAFSSATRARFTSSTLESGKLSIRRPVAMCWAWASSDSSEAAIGRAFQNA